MKKLLWLTIPLLINPVCANVILNNTRVIFNENQKETILKVHNDNAHPVLVQTWVDDGHQQHIANPANTISFLPTGTCQFPKRPGLEIPINPAKLLRASLKLRSIFLSNTTPIA